MCDTTYGDESPTGQSGDAFRGLGRATIAARIQDDGQAFDWLLAFRRDYLPDGAEPKGDLVLAVMQARPDARERVLAHIQSATIVVIDLGEH